MSTASEDANAADRAALEVAKAEAEQFAAAADLIRSLGSDLRRAGKTQSADDLQIAVVDRALNIAANISAIQARLSLRLSTEIMDQFDEMRRHCGGVLVHR